MPQGSRYDENGKLLWKFDICVEFDCNPEFAKVDCNCDFTKDPCRFLSTHKEMNIDMPAEKAFMDQNPDWGTDES